MDKLELPPVSQALIDCLSQRFDLSPPRSNEDLPRLYTRSGWSEVISFLQLISDKQNTGMSNQEFNDVLLKTEDTRSTSSSGRTPRRRTRRS